MSCDYLITKYDAKLLRDILEEWDAISDAKTIDEGSEHATDHRHDIYDAGWDLHSKLEKLSACSNQHYKPA